MVIRRLLRPLFGRRYSRNARVQYQRVGRFVRGAAAAAGGAAHVYSMKRKYSGRSRSFRKRPRFRSRRHFRGRSGGGTRFVSGQAGNAISTRYRSRHLSARRWRGALLSSTRFLPHYRSLFTTSFTQTSPVGVNSCTKTGLITLLPVNLPGPTPNPFWQTNGGALPIDDTVGVPTFDESSIVLRGGRSEVTVAAPSVDAIKLKIFFIFVKPGAGGGITAFNALTNVPALWDPTHFVDFNESFKLLGQWEYTLLPGSRPLSLIKTIKAQKIDWDQYRNFEGHLCYCFTMQQLTDINVLPDPVIYTVSHSVSFTGDSTA